MKKFINWLLGIQPQVAKQKKMTREIAESLFPLKVMVDMEIINEADVDNIHTCIGALALHKIFKDYNINDVHWGTMYGFIYFGKGVNLCLSIQSDTYMPDISDPQEVTLTLKHVQEFTQAQEETYVQEYTP